MSFIFVSIIYILILRESNSQVVLHYQRADEVFFVPGNLTQVPSGTTHLVEWFTTFPGAHHASYDVFDLDVASVEEFVETFNETTLEGNVTGKGYMVVAAKFIGFDVINVTVYDKENETLGTESFKMSVILSYEKFNTIFTYIMSVLVFVVYINMGATIDLTIVKQIVKKPVGPIVGVICQYVIMPLIAFGLAKVTFPDDQLRQLGMFLTGTAPGGGSSNMWTLLLGGSLNLSIMMTFVSTIVAFGAIPVWVLTLGPKIIGQDSEFQIPYGSIASIIVSLVIPCTIGLLMQRYLPKVAKFLEANVLTPFSAFNIIFIFTFGVYSHRYIFRLFTWKILLAGFALPVLGYISGFILSFLARRTWKDIIAISIETGVQNTTIPIIILKFTLGRPAGDLAVVIPACGVIMTPLPLLLAFIIKKLYGRVAHSGAKDISTSQDTLKEGIENGAMNQLSLTEVKNKATSNYEKEDSSTNHGAANGFVTRNNLSGVDNPSIVIENDAL